MRLTKMAQAFKDLLVQAPATQTTFTEQMAMMVDREWTERENRRLARLTRAAHLSISDATLEDAWCDPARGVEEAVRRESEALIVT
jgi:hypothetical protein